MIVTRFHDLEEIPCQIEFLTPSFLGGAKQDAELRSAPFKYLLRQWWRIVNGKLDPLELLKKEGELFGQVRGNDINVSKVRLHITEQDIKFYSKPDFIYPQYGIVHTEVNNRFIPVEGYLGMGPISWNKEKGRNEYKRPAIMPKSKCKMTVSFPKNETSFSKVFYCIKGFGTIGSRSRNGWGSLDISQTEIEYKTPVIEDFTKLMNDGRNYPHGLGKTDDGRVLVWETEGLENYIDIWKELAEIYLNVRTALPEMKEFTEVVDRDKEKPEFMAHRSASARHLLGYPLTHHKINDSTWGESEKNFKKPKKVEGRLSSPLRMTIKKSNGKFVGRILHIPYSVHMKFNGDQTAIWRIVHKFLDDQKTLRRMVVNP